MADPRLVVDSKDDAFKNPIGFIPNPQEPSQAVIDQFNKEFSLVKGVSALPARESVANKLSKSIDLGATATLPVGGTLIFKPISDSTTKLLDTSQPTTLLGNAFAVLNLENMEITSNNQDITTDQLKQIFPGASDKKLKSVRDAFNEVYDKFHLAHL